MNWQTWLSLTVNVRVLKPSKLFGSCNLTPGIVWGVDTSAINTEHLDPAQEKQRHISRIQRTDTCAEDTAWREGQEGRGKAEEPEYSLQSAGG